MSLKIEQLKNKNYFFWVTLFLSLMMLVSCTIVGAILFHYGCYKKDFGWKYSSEKNFYIVSEVSSDGLAANKLQVGDKILAINGNEAVQKNFFILGSMTNLRRKAIGTYTINIERSGVNRQFVLSNKIVLDYKILSGTLLFFLSSLIFSIFGLFVGLQRPEQKLTRRLTLSMFATACFMLLVSIALVKELFDYHSYFVFLILWAIYPIIFPLSYDVYSRFPSDMISGRVWSIARYFLYIYAAIMVFIGFWRNIFLLKDSFILEFPFNNNLFLSLVDNAFDLLIVITLILLVAVIIRNYKLVKDANQKRRVKWMVYGSILGLFPTLVNNLSTFLLNSSDTYRYIINTNYYFFFGRFAEFFITIIPISLIYVILKHQVFEINFIVRRGLQYLLAKNSLRAVLVLEVVGVIFIAVLNPELTLGAVFSPKHFYFYLVLITVGSFFYRVEITNILDKKFFSEAYNRERVLTQLLEEIKQLKSIREISVLVSNRLLEVLYPRSFYIFYYSKESNNFILELAGDISRNINSTSTITLEVPELIQVIRSLEIEIAKETDFFQNIPTQEQQQLINLQTQLVIPMIGVNKALLGILLVGEKHSQEPYSQKDKKLLEDIAHQLGVVYENSLLKEEVSKEERIKQEVLTKLENKNISLVKECPECGRCFDSNIEFCDQDKKALALSLPIERVIEDKYRLEKLLGKGGMGAVYIAKDLSLGRDVAVKVLRASMFGDQGAVKRFEREAKASAKLTHPNIIAIYDYGKLALEGAYLVMELVEGVTLKAKLNQERVLAPLIVADLFEQILDAIKVAHQAGIIHRDLKPDNILILEVSGRLSAKVLDFGLAKVKFTNSKVDSNSLTAPGTVMGTFGYMPPEQFSGEAIDERVDIFALGVILVELLTGSKPFIGKTVYEIMGAMLKSQYHLPGNSREIKELDENIQKTIAKNPKDRFGSIAEMQEKIIPAIRKCSNSSFSTAINQSSSEAETKIRK